MRAAKKLPFPEFMLATENHVEQVDVSRNRRLKNVEILMQWQPQVGEEDSHVVLLSLREAQTLRRAMQAKAPSLPPIILFTVAGEVLAQSAAARNLQRKTGSQAATLLRQRELGRQCAKFYDCNFFYHNEELLMLLKALAIEKNAAQKREVFFSGTKGALSRGGKQIVGILHGRKRRSVLDWEGTPVEALFQHDQPDNFERTIHLAALTRTALQQKWRDEHPEVGVDEVAPLEQLFYMIAGQNKSTISISNAVQQLAEILEESHSDAQVSDLPRSLQPPRFPCISPQLPTSPPFSHTSSHAPPARVTRPTTRPRSSC